MRDRDIERKIRDMYASGMEYSEIRDRIRDIIEEESRGIKESVVSGINGIFEVSLLFRISVVIFGIGIMVVGFSTLI